LRPNAARLMSATLYLRAGPDILITKICNVLSSGLFWREDGGGKIESGRIILLRAENPAAYVRNIYPDEP
jgi:hypothetical protein